MSTIPPTFTSYLPCSHSLDLGKSAFSISEIYLLPPIPINEAVDMNRQRLGRVQRKRSKCPRVSGTQSCARAGCCPLLHLGCLLPSHSVNSAAYLDYLFLFSMELSVASASLELRYILHGVIIFNASSLTLSSWLSSDVTSSKKSSLTLTGHLRHPSTVHHWGHLLQCF